MDRPGPISPGGHPQILFFFFIFLYLVSTIFYFSILFYFIWVWRLREVVKVSPPKRQVDSSNPTGDVLKLNLRSVIVAYERLGAKPVTLVPPS